MTGENLKATWDCGREHRSKKDNDSSPLREGDGNTPALSSRHVMMFPMEEGK